MRTLLRGLGYVVSELIPAQAVRVAMNKDFARVAAERDVWRERAEILRDGLVAKEAEEDVANPAWPVLPCYVCGQTYTPEGHVCHPSDSPVPPAGDTPTPVEPDSPLAPGVGTPDLLVSTFGPPPTVSSDLADLRARVEALENHRHTYMAPDAGGLLLTTSAPKPNK